MNVIVTGSSRGIGYEIVKSLALKHECYILSLSRNKELLKNLEEECNKLDTGSKVIPFPFDLTCCIDNPGVLLEKVLKYFARVDILINNAGFLVNKPFEKLNVVDARKIFDVNFFGPVFLIHELINIMGKDSVAHVVNIGSMGGFQGSSKYPGLSFYSASKAALASITECLSQEYKDSKICFNCLALGAVQTEMLNEAFPGYKAPLNASEIADFIADFALSGHKYTNGKIIPVSLSNP